jgi:protein subunit release factor A
MFSIPSDDMDLLAECEVDVYRASGHGGQNVNRRETAVRLTHVPSGVVITCQDERSQWANKRRALQRLRGRLEALNRPRRPRVATSIPAAVHRQRLADKRHRARVKQERARRDQSGD